MTWALCLNCGEVKFGAICPCPECKVKSTGDMNVDIAFSDHHIAKNSLEKLGDVIRAIHSASDDDDLCFWTFIHYVARNYPTILGVDLEPEVVSRAEEILVKLTIPDFNLESAR